VAESKLGSTNYPPILVDLICLSFRARRCVHGRPGRWRNRSL